MTNQDLLNIAQEFGTPVYVYDADSIKTQYEKLKTSFGEQTKFFYGCKSLTNINILKQYIPKKTTATWAFMPKAVPRALKLASMNRDLLS